MKQVMHSLLFASIIGIIVTCLLLSWQFERWINWKLDYSARVDRKLESLEQRVRSLELQRVPIISVNPATE